VRSVSIGLRLSLLYASSAFFLIFAATGFLYWVLESNLVREDTRFSRDELENVRLILRAAEPPARISAKGAKSVVDDDRELYVRLIDRTGTTVMETPGMTAVVASPPTTAFLSTVHHPSGVRQDVVTRDDGAFQILTATLAMDGTARQGFVQVAMNRGDEERLLALYRQRLMLVLVLSLLATTAVGYLIARGGMRPRIGQAAERIGTSTLHQRIASDGLPAELRGLADTFNTMLDRLEDSFGRVSRFSDDVAHELRTPVNNLRGEIEVALAHPRAVEDYEAVLGSCLEECARISRIITSLLFLARADGAEDRLDIEEIDVVRESAAVLDFYEAAAADKGVTLALTGAPSAEVRLDRTLFQQALGNLVANAIAYTPSGGSVEVAIEKIPCACVVTVADTGSGIAMEHQPYVFDRLYRADAARSGATNVGLGLAVVKSIVERHGGRVTIDSAPGKGTAVSMDFRAQQPSVR
jgi:two-component system heavy metal sensor histidine kinase CusS